MSFHVQGKVVTPCKTALAHFAFERLCTRVLPIMPGQLVRPGKLIVTLWPLAGVRLFPCVNSLVGLEVGALGVDLVAARKVAMVGSSFFQLGVVSPSVVLEGGAGSRLPWDGGGQGGGGGGAGGEGGGVGGVRGRRGVAGAGGGGQWEGERVAHSRAVT